MVVLKCEVLHLLLSLKTFDEQEFQQLYPKFTQRATTYKNKWCTNILLQNKSSDVLGNDRIVIKLNVS